MAIHSQIGSKSLYHCEVLTTLQPRFDLDYIRAYATIMIVLLHISVAYIHQNDISAVNWWVSNTFHAFSRTAVPLFVMLSGALLLQPRHPESLGKFLHKPTLRILPPMFIWSLTYLIYLKATAQSDTAPLQAIYSLLEKPAYGHLWFLYMILGLYLMTPMLRVYVAHASRTNLRYSLALWFIFAQVIPYLQKTFQFHFHLQNFYTMTGFLGLFVGGYFLDRLSLNLRLKWSSIGLFIIGFLSLALLTYWTKVENGGAIQSFVYEINSPFSLMTSASSFLLLKSFAQRVYIARSKKMKMLITSLSSTSFTIYLLHMMVINLMFQGFWGLKFSPAHDLPLSSIPLQTLVVLIICWLFTVTLRKLPFGRWVAP